MYNKPDLWPIMYLVMAFSLLYPYLLVVNQKLRVQRYLIATNERNYV